MTQPLNSQVFVLEIGTLMFTQKPVHDCLYQVYLPQTGNKPKWSIVKWISYDTPIPWNTSSQKKKKRNKLLIRSTAWMVFKGIVLSEKVNLKRSYTLWLYLGNVLTITKLQWLSCQGLGLMERVWLWGRGSMRKFFVLVEQFCIKIGMVIQTSACDNMS